MTVESIDGKPFYIIHGTTDNMTKGTCDFTYTSDSYPAATNELVIDNSVKCQLDGAINFTVSIPVSSVTDKTSYFIHGEFPSDSKFNDVKVSGSGSVVYNGLTYSTGTMWDCTTLIVS